MSCNCGCNETSTTLPIGPTGATGADGTNGTNGTDGSDGTNGTNGTNGKTFMDTSISTADGTVTSTALTYVSDLVYPGTTALGTAPTSLRVIANASAGKQLQVSIVDITNSVVIGTLTTTQATKAILTLPISGSISATEAIWELQGRIIGSADGDTAYFYAWSVF